jgi:hypothetical protein
LLPAVDDDVAKAVLLDARHRLTFRSRYRRN